MKYTVELPIKVVADVTTIDGTTVVSDVRVPDLLFTSLTVNTELHAAAVRALVQLAKEHREDVTWDFGPVLVQPKL